MKKWIVTKEDSGEYIIEVGGKPEEILVISPYMDDKDRHLILEILKKLEIGDEYDLFGRILII